MSYTLCLECHTIEGFNPCGCSIVICPKCGNVYDGNLTRLPDKAMPSGIGHKYTQQDLELAHFPGGAAWIPE